MPRLTLPNRYQLGPNRLYSPLGTYLGVCLVVIIVGGVVKAMAMTFQSYDKVERDYMLQ